MNKRNPDGSLTPEAFAKLLDVARIQNEKTRVFRTKVRPLSKLCMDELCERMYADLGEDVVFIDFKTSNVEPGSEYQAILKKYGFHSLKELTLETSDA